MVIFNLFWLQISDVAEEEVRKLEKTFKEGSHVCVRVLGFRHLEGLATGILKVVLVVQLHFFIRDLYNMMTILC
jgi:rRNA biogenesis protein RRP5